MLRHLAADLVMAVLGGDRTSDAVLDEAVETHRLDPRERGFLRELVFGVLRRHATLEWIIAQFSNIPLHKLHPRIRLHLAVALYQLIFLERVPAAIAVDQAVGTIKREFSSKAASLANGILRTVGRSFSKGPPPRPLDPQRFLWIDDTYGAIFSKPLFPPLSRNRLQYLEVQYSYLEFLVRRWVGRFGTMTTEEICRAGNRRPEIWLRCNTLRTSRDELALRLRAEGIDTAPGSFPESLRVVGSSRGLFDTTAFAQGYFQVQDETAMRVVERLDPQPGERILDLCAAPGGKTTHIAARMADRGEVIAVDVAAERLALVEDNCRRLGVSCVRTHLVSRSLDDGASLAPFDRILVDAPCSNTGVLARRAEARWKVSAYGLEELTRLQRELLERASSKIKPGGRFVYSTCSIEEEENQRIVQWFLEMHPAWRLVEENLTLPHADADGGFVAVIVPPGHVL